MSSRAELAFARAADVDPEGGPLAGSGPKALSSGALERGQLAGSQSAGSSCPAAVSVGSIPSVASFQGRCSVWSWPKAALGLAHGGLGRRRSRDSTTSAPVAGGGERSRLGALSHAGECKKAKKEGRGAIPPGAAAVAPSVTRGMLANIEQGKPSTFVASPLGAILSSIAQGPGRECQDEDVETLVGEYCPSAEMQVTSMTARAVKLALDTRRLIESLMLLASALAISDHQASRALECAVVASPGLAPLMILEVVSYGKTPMETKTAESVYDVAAKFKGQEECQQEDSAGLAFQKVSLGSAVGPSKLFQTAASGTILAKNRSLEEHGQFLTLFSHPVTWVQPLESSSAEVLRAALEQISTLTASSRAPPLKVRAAGSDRFASNLKAERCIANGRSDDWACLHSPSVVHSAAGAQLKTPGASELAWLVRWPRTHADPQAAAAGSGGRLPPALLGLVPLEGSKCGTSSDGACGCGSTIAIGRATAACNITRRAVAVATSRRRPSRSNSPERFWFRSVAELRPHCHTTVGQAWTSQWARSA